MIEIIRYTTEDAFYKSLREDPRTAGIVLGAADTSSINMSITFNYSIPAKYAKYLLKEHIKNEIQTT